MSTLTAHGEVYNIPAKLKPMHAILSKLMLHCSNPFAIPPSITLVKRDQVGASFDPMRNVIKIEEGLLAVCRKLGRDSTSALAFVISHELVHVLQSARSMGSKEIMFLGNEGTGLRIYQNEVDADISGAFLCYTAGYKVTGVLEEFMDLLYAKYKPAIGTAQFYPSRDQRKASVVIMLQRLNVLILLFESAVWLNMASQSELAEMNYQKILQQYSGPEIYNNLGVTRILNAMKLYPDIADKFVYPFEIDLNSSMKRARTARGELSAEMGLLRKLMMESALSCFEEASRRKPDYAECWPNIISSLNLLGRPSDAINYYYKVIEKFPLLTRQQVIKEKLELAVGISYMMQGRAEADSMMKACSKSGQLLIRLGGARNSSKTDIFNLEDGSSKPCKIQSWQSGLIQIKSFSKNDFNMDTILPMNNKGLILAVRRTSGSVRLEYRNAQGPLLRLEQSRVRTNQPHRISQFVSGASGIPDLIYVPGIERTLLKCSSDDGIFVLNRRKEISELILCTLF
ncbi:MAG: hypothetical protein K1X68_04515 [Saprospiraceae bacterium]|nr:hypothetical protein [Saprospiraceae bacterium]HMW39631.1 hypothetical protein [Saprospiraceae bacterium]HMX88730.1 hypothetical protein [Saprospiraceae bacterium]HMZ38862.1 hypothetical protein [Saprospiraceae bacterium]HNA65545.1 hypothetical protein [Saprospiraceae bacterium]